MSMGEMNLVIPDVVEPILAHRAFTTAGSNLRSIQHWGTNWPVQEPLEADCRFYEGQFADGAFQEGCGRTPCQDPALHTGHGCGIYAFAELEDLAKNYQSDRYVLGQVLLSGAVFQHEHGYRAERARVHAIYYTGRLTERTYAERYGVPLVHLDPNALDMWKLECKAKDVINRVVVLSRSKSFHKTTDMLGVLDLTWCIGAVGVGIVDTALRRAWRRIHG